MCQFNFSRLLKEDLRSMGGAGPAAVDYESLIDKFVDPKLPDRYSFWLRSNQVEIV